MKRIQNSRPKPRSVQSNGTSGGMKYTIDPASGAAVWE